MDAAGFNEHPREWCARRSMSLPVRLHITCNCKYIDGLFLDCPHNVMCSDAIQCYYVDHPQDMEDAYIGIAKWE